MINIRRLVPAMAVLTLAASLVSTQAASASSTVTPLPCSPWHVDMLTHRGGAVIGLPEVDLIFWGSWWKSNDSRATGAIAELTSLFSGLGTSAWANTVTQYCAPQPAGVIAPEPNAKYQTDSMLDNAIIDPSDPPANPSEQDFTDEAAKEAYWDFGGHQVPMIITPPGVSPAYDVANGGCAHHHWGSEPTSVLPVINYYAWAEVPYELASSANCQPKMGKKSIGTSGALSMLAGHEWAETVTDPFGTANLGSWFSDGWTAQTPSGSIEIGDLCQPIANVDGVPQEDVTGHIQSPFSLPLSTGTFVMQTLWSNEAGPASQQGRCVEGSKG